MNFLIVDDHAGLRSMIRDVIAAFASNVRECASGEEAVAACRQYIPDCVTVDLRMKGMDGLTCVQHLRRLHPDCHIAVVTQFDHDGLRVRARQAGADTYIVKDNLELLRQHFHMLSTQLGE